MKSTRFSDGRGRGLTKLGRLLAFTFVFGIGPACGAAAAAPENAAAPVRCAVLVADGPGGAGDALPLADLLRAELGSRGKLELVERSDVERVLEEQRLGEALGAAQTARRAALGKLLRADLLVLLRSGPTADAQTGGAGNAAELPAAHERHVRLVVCETGRGLRLVHGVIPLSTDAQADAVAAAELVDGALAKLGAPRREVVAVPPFASRDLTFEFEHLKGAYARLIEQALLGRDDVLVVELAEAQSLASEVALAGGPAVQRDLPLYVLGSYRTSRAGGAGPVSVAVGMSLRRGERDLDSESKDALPAEAVPDCLAASLAAWAKHFGTGGPAPAIAHDVEARQLTARADEFYRVGEWAEAAELFEASLLLDPKQVEPRLALAMSLARRPLTPEEEDASLGKALRRRGASAAQRAAETAIIERLIARFRRRVDHLELYLRNGTHEDPTGKLIQLTWPPFAVGYTTYAGHEALAGFNERVGRAERDAFLRVIRARASADGPRDGVVWAVLRCTYRWRVGRETSEDGLRLMMSVFREVAHLPDAPRYATVLLGQSLAPAALGMEWDGKDTRERRRFMAARKSILVDPLMTWPDARVATLLERDLRLGTEMEARALAERRAALASTNPSAPAHPTDDAVGVAFQPFDLVAAVASAGGKLPPLAPGDHWRWMPVGSDIDLIRSGQGAWLMRAGGRIESAFPGMEPIGSPMAFGYDGRYLWAVVHAKGSNRPIAVAARDLSAGGRTWRVMAHHGLPFSDADDVPDIIAGRRQHHVVAIAGVSPGRACVAGHFGRTWIAMVSIDPEAGPTAKVFHEARDTPPRGTFDDGWASTSVAFEPEGMFVLRGPPGPDERRAHRVVITGRGDRPLLIDPDTLAVTTMAERLVPHQAGGPANRAFAEHDGTLYVVTSPSFVHGSPMFTGELRGPHLYRVGLPDLKPVAVMTSVPQSFVRFHGGRVTVVGRGAWALELDAKRIWPLASRVPWFHANQFWTPDDEVASVWPDKLPDETWVLREVFVSNHYGLLVVASNRAGASVTFRAEFPEPPKR